MTESERSSDHECDPGMIGIVSGDDVCAGGKLETPTPPPPLGPFQRQTSFLAAGSVTQYHASASPDKISRCSQRQGDWLGALPCYAQADQGTRVWNLGVISASSLLGSHPHQYEAHQELLVFSLKSTTFATSVLARALSIPASSTADPIRRFWVL